MGRALIDAGSLLEQYRALLFLQAPSGGLSAPPAFVFEITQFPCFAAIGDLNGDGRNDFALTRSQNVNVYLQDSAGAFPASPSQVLLANSSNNKILIQDTNGDGRNDVLVANSLRPGGIEFFLQGQGTPPHLGVPSRGLWYPNRIVPTDNIPTGLAVGDVNGDGRMDMAVSTEASNVLDIYVTR